MANGQKAQLEGTGIGAGIGAIFGGVGAAPGAAIGGAVGKLIGQATSKKPPAPPKPFWKKHPYITAGSALAFLLIVYFVA